MYSNIQFNFSYELQSRRHHETSMGHKIKTEQFLKQKKNEKLQETRNEQELKRTLEQMEKAARAAMNQPVTREIPNWVKGKYNL